MLTFRFLLPVHGVLDLRLPSLADAEAHAATIRARGFYRV